VHHDVRPGNFFWRDGRPGLLDWHLVRLGEGVGDVAYFLSTVLLPQTRRKHEERLLSRYRDVLLERGVEAPGLDALARRFRSHLVYPFEAMVVTLAVGGMMKPDANLELIRRTAAAVADHDSFADGPRGGRV
jgi:aminoglycoside phosphotransferase (APT) family kinase protein